MDFIMYNKPARITMKKIQISVTACMLFFSACAHAASFDCKKATTIVEKLICGDSRLSAYDSALAKLYKTEMKKTNNKNTLKQDQRDWLKNRNTCESSACIAKAYINRIDELPVKYKASFLDVESRSRMASYMVLHPNDPFIQRQPHTLFTKHPYVLIKGDHHEMCRVFTNYLNSDYYKKGNCTIGDYPPDKRLQGIIYKPATAIDYEDFYLQSLNHINDEQEKRLEVNRLKELLRSGNISAWIGEADIKNVGEKDVFLVSRYYVVRDGVPPQFCKSLGGEISRLMDGHIDNGAWGGYNLPEPFVFDGKTFLIREVSNGENTFFIDEPLSSGLGSHRNNQRYYGEVASKEVCGIRESVFYLM